MSIASEITRLQTAKANLKTAIETKGVTVSSSALLDDYPALVESIPSGGGAIEEKTVNFVDFDGTLVASYTGAEAQSLTALPDAPNHNNDEAPLTFDEWNWTLAEIKSYNTTYPKAIITVGANYHTTDGKYHLWFDTTGLSESTVAIEFDTYSTTTKTVNWGDGTATEILSGRIIEHTYTNGLKNHCVIETTASVIGGRRNDGISRYKKLSLTSIRCPSHCVRINTYLYFHLEDISIPSGANLYEGNTYAMKCVVVPRGQTTATDYAFSGHLLRYLSISPLFTGALSYAITNSSLTSLFVPNATSFSGIRENNQLLSVWLPSCIPYNNNATFEKCYSLLDAHLKNQDITSLPPYFFRYCEAIRNIDIPESVTEIGSYAFDYCYSLEEITLPANVQTIGSSAFSYNTLCLRRITALPTTPPTLSSPIYSPIEKIYVPYSADHSILAAYQAATNWSNFASIMEELPE